MASHLLFDLPLVAAAATVGITVGAGPAIALGAVGLGVHTWAVASPRSSFYLPVIWRLGADSPGLALTFDDGPNPEVTPRLLDLLAERRQRATFFVIGQHVRAHGALVRRMVDEGHAIGRHSDGHSRWFNCWGPAAVARDLDACGQAIADAAGIPPPRLFRPPVGLKNPLVAHAVRRLGLRTVTWSARGFDTTGAAPAVVLRRLGRGLGPGSILLLHDGHEPTRPAARATCLAVLPDLLALIAQRDVRSLALRGDDRGVALVEESIIPG
jgi:peptidoglycan/xylan/chitin deacetylase (PgdA/CDA1 family)